MRTIRFPPPSSATEDGIVAMGGDLEVDILVSAYEKGIFPWPHEGYPLLWFCPWERGILEFQELHVSRSLRKFAQSVTWTWTLNRAFDEVIAACAKSPRPGSTGTWITPEMVSAYQKFHRAGYAHSVEVWDNQELIGGIYGVFVKNVFSAESMFYRQSNASKWALWQLVTFLQNQGLDWMDVQMVTSVTESFGAKLITQEKFLEKLRQSHEKVPIRW